MKWFNAVSDPHCRRCGLKFDLVELLETGRFRNGEWHCKNCTSVELWIQERLTKPLPYEGRKIVLSALKYGQHTVA